MSQRVLFAAVLTAAVAATWPSAVQADQEYRAGPYVSGYIGASGGDGGAALAGGGAVGYMTTRRVGSS